ncbi:MAG: hypothetical protein OZ921_20345 [Sorangiineae bacterium]|nr:hypothetical protein [Polyangiaceae bacterium]MEB2324875.1 hypothetical protein [Sorangiineae bacterium]
MAVSLPPRPRQRLVAASAAAAAVACASAAQALPVRVHGTASLEAHAVARAGELELRGALRDDAGRPVEGRLRATLPRRAGPPPSARTCGDGRPATPVPVEGDAVVIDLDGAGTFCVRVAGAPETGRVRVAYGGSAFYEAASAELPIDASRLTLTLRFSPEPTALALDRPVHSIWVEATAATALAEDAPPETVALVLAFHGRGGQPTELGRASVRVGERALFEVPSVQLGAAGPGTLTVSSPGTASVQAATRSVTVERTARVTLSLTGKPEPADPRDGLELRVAVGSALGAVPTGSVEATLDGESVGAARVVAGAARVVAVFDAPSATQARLSLRYLPDAPWWTPGDVLEVTAPLAAPSPWRRAPWVLGAAAVALWLMRGWRRPGRAPRARPSPAAASRGFASLALVERGPVERGWRGRVLDAHEGTPVAGARVTLEAPGFGGGALLAASESDGEGRFELAPPRAALPDGARMTITARWHGALRRAVPPPGLVLVTLVSRRRALLDGLVEWARRSQRAWAGPGEPTPGALARSARARGNDAVAEWAEQIETAAYGPTPPDESVEAAIEARAPRGGAANSANS